MNVQQFLARGRALAGRAADRWRPPLCSLQRADQQVPCAQPDCCRERQTTDDRQRLRGAAAAGAGSCLDHAVTRQPGRRMSMRYTPTALATVATAATGNSVPASAAGSAAAGLAASSPGVLAPEVGIGRSPAKLAVFVSGGGSNLKALHAATQDGRINGSIVAVVSDNPGCGGWQFAQQHGIDVLQFPSKRHVPGEHAVELGELPAALQAVEVDYICLAGFLKSALFEVQLIPVELVRAFHRRILNIHPALLPAFGGAGYYGARVHRAVVASGARFTGASIHFIDEAYDTGPILAQRVVRVLPTDTPQQVAARVLAEEHKVYPEAVAALCDGRVTWREDGVPIIWEGR